MDLETFLLERNQSLFENEVEINLTESGVEALSIGELLRPAEREALCGLQLGYGYTEGSPELRAAIATWYPGAAVDNVLVTTGAAEANFLTIWTLCQAGDEVVFVIPNFLQIQGIARAFGVRLRTVTLDSRRDWRLDTDALAAAVGPETRLIALCNPNNPTGAVLSAGDRDRVVEIAERAGAWLFVDEIYRGAEIGDRLETATFWGRYERTVVTGSTSKSLAHPGLRLGWLVAPTDMLGDVLRRQDYVTIGTGPINQFVAACILRPDRRQELLKRSREILARNVARVDDWVTRWNGRLSYVRPAAGGMAFVQYDFPINSTELTRLIRERESVFVVAGDWFGLDGHLRIGIGGDTATLEEGLRRIDSVLRDCCVDALV
jgi:aspartate/methionine/tyrosine aminotransferase